MCACLSVRSCLRASACLCAIGARTLNLSTLKTHTMAYSLTHTHTHTHTHTTTTHTNAHAGWTCVGSGIEHGRVFSSLFPRCTCHLLHPAVNLSSLSWIDHCTHMRRACLDVVQTEGGAHHIYASPGRVIICPCLTRAGLVVHRWCIHKCRGRCMQYSRTLVCHTRQCVRTSSCDGKRSGRTRPSA